MGRFLLRRLVEGVVTLLVLSIVVFLLARMTGDPTDLLVPPEATAEDQAQLRRALGLDQPYHVQYLLFIEHAIQGDFGNSIRQQRPAMTLVTERLPNSLLLAIVAMAFSLIVSFPLGVISAARHGRWQDKISRIVAVAGMAAPSFLVGLLLMDLLSVRLRWLPSAGMNNLSSFVMPGITLGLFAMASLIRLLHSSMLEVIDSEFVKLARLKGLSERVVIWKHALRNSILPVLTMTGIYFQRVITMAIVVETVFAWPGVGRLSYEAIMYRDFPVIQAVVIVGAALVILVNLLVDIGYAYLDPRIRQA